MKARLSSPSAGRIMAAVAVGLALAVCGTIAALSGTTARMPSLPATSQACQAAQLSVVVDSSAARRTADGTEVPVNLVNQWREECVLRGYLPVTGVATTAGHDAQAVHMAGNVTSVVLGQFYAAHTWVLIANAPGGPAAGCRQLSAKGLRVFLPRTTGHVWVPYPFTACAGTGQALLSVRPVLQGFANPAFYP